MIISKYNTDIDLDVNLLVSRRPLTQGTTQQKSADEVTICAILFGSVYASNHANTAGSACSVTSTYGCTAATSAGRCFRRLRGSALGKFCKAAAKTWTLSLTASQAGKIAATSGSSTTIKLS